MTNFLTFYVKMDFLFFSVPSVLYFMLIFILSYDVASGSVHGAHMGTLYTLNTHVH